MLDEQKRKKIFRSFNNLMVVTNGYVSIMLEKLLTQVMLGSMRLTEVIAKKNIKNMVETMEIVKDLYESEDYSSIDIKSQIEGKSCPKDKSCPDDKDKFYLVLRFLDKEYLN